MFLSKLKIDPDFLEKSRVLLNAARGLPQEVENLTKKVVATGYKGLNPTAPVPATYGQAFKQGLGMRAQNLQNQFSYDPNAPEKGIGETAMNFVGGTNAVRPAVNAAIAPVRKAAAPVFEGFQDLATKTLRGTSQRKVYLDSLLPTDRPMGTTLADMKFSGNKANVGKTTATPIGASIERARRVSDSGGDGAVGNYSVDLVERKLRNGRLTVYHGTDADSAAKLGGWKSLRDGSYLSLTPGREKEALGVYGARFYADVAERNGKVGEVLKYEIPLNKIAVDDITGELRYIGNATSPSKISDQTNALEFGAKMRSGWERAYPRLRSEPR